MAPRNKPIPTFDTEPDQLFRLWQEANRIPSRYNSWEELKADFMSRIADGKSAPQARKEMGVDYKNIIGNPILNIEKNKDTGAVEFAEGGMRRAIREDFNIAEENEIRRIHGQEEVDRFRAELKNDWNNLSEGERVAIQRQFNKQFHRGHVAGAKTGGSIARENMWPEHGMRNSLHGALPRWPVQVMEQLGVPKDWIGAYYEKVLASEGMPAAPRISDELAMAADERMVTPVSGMPSNIKGQTRWASDIPTDVRKKKWQPDLTGEAGIDPATLEMRAWKQQDAMAQVGEEAVRAQQANLSATMNRGSAVAQSSPMRIVQEGTTVVPYKTPKLGKALGRAGKPDAAPSIDPELVSQFSRQIGNRINRRLGQSPFDETLNTTSQKYLENIGKYQQFIDLDEASKAALGLYGENVKQYYADLNRQLRTGSSANLTPQQIAVNEFLQGNLSRTLDALPSEQRDLYRAIKDPVREGLVDLKVGDIYTDKGFGSFSADEKAALRFIRKDAPSALITVQNAEGKNIGPVMEFDEAEFLQKPGAQYRLEAVDEIFSPKVNGTVPNYRFTQVTSSSLGQKAAAIANREPVPPPKPVVVVPKPAAKPKPAAAKPKPKAVTKPTPVVTTRTTKVKPTSASMQIRAMQNTVPDVMRIQPGMSLPSTSLIQGI